MGFLTLLSQLLHNQTDLFNGYSPWTILSMLQPPPVRKGTARVLHSVNTTS